jgi:hypothetical protein
MERSNLFCGAIWRPNNNYSYRDYFSLLEPIPYHPCRLIRVGRLHMFGTVKRWENHANPETNTYGLGKTSFLKGYFGDPEENGVSLVPNGRVILNRNPRGPGSGTENLLECYLPPEASQIETAITLEEAIEMGA